MPIFRHMILAAVVLPIHAHATAFQDIDAIEARAAEAASGAVRPVDRRLKLVACPEKLSADPPVIQSITVRCASLGWRVRVLIDGTLSPASNAPIAIRRGDPVSVNFVANGFSVTTSGIAESEARIGERVRVRVEQKTTPVMGQVIDAGNVQVGGLN